MERVIGYRPVERDVIFQRPVKWQGGESGQEFKEFPPIMVKKELYRPIYEDLGPKVNTTLESEILSIEEVDLGAMEILKAREWRKKYVKRKN